jgi:predicted pyridoxine 5'-phosphate oxidase superfamily flavin-nucleotide-binding protein
VDAYAVTLPKVIRWQAELAAVELSEADAGKLASASLRTSSRLLARLDDLLSDEGIDRLSRKVEASLSNERVAVFASVDRERREIMDRLGRDEDVTLRNVNEQRVATLADVDGKIRAALDGADAIRARAVAGIEEVAARTILRAALAVACLMVLGAVLAFLVRRTGAPARRN